MAVPLSFSTLRLPSGFQALLESVTQEILLMQPSDIYTFAALYFESLLAIREDNGKDSSVDVAKLEDRFYNCHAFLKPGGSIEASVEEEKAATRIQSTYRRHQARSAIDDLRLDKAAVTIQSAVRGFLARRRVRRVREEDERRRLENLAAAAESDEDDELKDLFLEEGEAPAATENDLLLDKPKEMKLAPEADEAKGQTTSDDGITSAVSNVAMATSQAPSGAEEPVDIDLADPEVQKAAVFIQSGFKGFKMRKSSRETTQSAAVETRDADGNLKLSTAEVKEAVDKIQSGFRAAITTLEAAPDVNLHGEEQMVTSDVKDNISYASDSEDEQETTRSLSQQQQQETGECCDPVARSEAVTKIQAAFRGMKTRRQLNATLSIPSKLPKHPEGDGDTSGELEPAEERAENQDDTGKEAGNELEAIGEIKSEEQQQEEEEDGKREADDGNTEPDGQTTANSDEVAENQTTEPVACHTDTDVEGSEMVEIDPGDLGKSAEATGDDSADAEVNQQAETNAGAANSEEADLEDKQQVVIDPVDPSKVEEVAGSQLDNETGDVGVNQKVENNTGAENTEEADLQVEIDQNESAEVTRDGAGDAEVNQQVETDTGAENTEEVRLQDNKQVEIDPDDQNESAEAAGSQLDNEAGDAEDNQQVETTTGVENTETGDPEVSEEVNTNTGAENESTEGAANQLDAGNDAEVNQQVDTGRDEPEKNEDDDSADKVAETGDNAANVDANRDPVMETEPSGDQEAINTHEGEEN